MKERPILFSAPMVRATLKGRKTQTRRVVKDHHIDAAPPACFFQWLRERCPYGQPGDRLWVRETWQHSNFQLGPYDESCTVFYRADYMDDPHGPDGEKSPEGRYRNWVPSIHMFRSASRITLEITAVRVERLQDISETDARAEGIEQTVTGDGWRRYCADIEQEAAGLTPCSTAEISYRSLWESINGPGAWEANPWVWVVEFRRVGGKP